MSAPGDEALPGRLAAAVERIASVLGADARRTGRERGLPGLQQRILRELVSRPGPRMGELAESLRVTAGTVSASVSNLESKGLVKRSPDPDEHRVVRVHPTRAGRAELARIDRPGDDAGAALVQALGESESGELLARLLRVIQALEHAGVLNRTRMCLHCEHFRPFGGRGARPHRCALLEANLLPRELRVDCPEFEPAPGDELATRWTSLGGNG